MDLSHFGADSDADPQSTPPRLGGFRVEHVLGHGAAGLVYLAFRESDGLPVALKVFRFDRRSTVVPEISSSRRETRSLRSLDHPGIARFVGAGELESALGTHAYVATEFVEGATLRQHMANPAGPGFEPLALLANLCDAIEHAHRRGIVHRDLKPENIVIRSDGRPVILDFGIARFLEPEVGMASVTTGVGRLVGTVRYMSPEQAQADRARVGPGTDIYALGVIGFELLSGELPYSISAENVPEAILTIVTQQPRLLGEVDARWRGAAEAILARALEKRIEARYRTAGEMARDLRRALSGRSLSIRTRGRARRRVDAWFRHLAPAHSRMPRIALSAAVAVPLVVWGGRLWSSRNPAVGRPAALERYYDLLDTADAVRHAVDPWQTGVTGQAAADACEPAIAFFERILGMWSGLPPHPTAKAELQYIRWRLAELHYFAGMSSHDPDRIEQACEHFEAARDVAWAPLDSDAPEPWNGVLARIAMHGPQVFPGGCAMCENSLARYTAPVVHLRRAVDFRREALRAFDAGTRQHPGLPTLRASERPLLEHQLGVALVRAGVAGDDIGWLDEGRQVMLRIDAAAWTPEHRAELRRDLGVAWRRRADLTRSPADVDSALAWLESAAKEPTGDADRWRTALEIAFSAAAAAAIDPSPARRAVLERCVAEVQADAAAGLDPRGDAFSDGWTSIALADLHLCVANLGVAVESASLAGDQVERAGIDREMEEARGLLDRSETAFSDPRLVVPRAELFLQRGRWLRLWWQREEGRRQATRDGGEAGDSTRAAALKELHRAAAVLSSTEFPRLRRLIQAEFRALDPDRVVAAP